MPREINEAGYRLIKEFEAGPRGNSLPALVPYICPAGKLTIGWGHTGPDVKPGMLITEAQAQALLEKDLDWAEEAVEKACPGANDNEFSAMVSLTLNIGPEGFRGSTVARLFNRGDKAGAAAAFAMWRKIRAGGTGPLVDSAGLIRRRGVEAALFLTPMPAGHLADAPFERVQPMPQAVSPEKSAVSSKTVIAGGVGVATAATSVADQIEQVVPIINSLTTAGASVQNLLKLGGLALSIVALGAVAYMLWRYLGKRRRGEVVST